MKTNYKLNPNRILGYIMAFAIICLNYNVAISQNCKTMVMLCPSGAITVPGLTSTTPTTISTCNYQNEHSQLTGVDSGFTYSCENITNGGWITIYEGSDTGTFVAAGPSPLNWTAISNNDHWVHWTVTGPPACTQATSVCNTTQITFLTNSSNLVWGCTDPVALNYDTAATINDGSCTYVMGCMDTLACNYDSLATADDGSCATTYGCMDTLACNYDTLATCSDVSACLYGTTGCMDPFASNYDASATCSDSLSCLYHGCQDIYALNYNSSANADCDTIAGGNSTSCCVYSAPNLAPFCENWESANILTNDWVTTSGSEASVSLNAGTFTVNQGGQVIGPLNDTVSLFFEGGSFTGWNYPTTEAQAYANTSHIASALVKMDFSQSTAPCQMKFNLELYSGYMTEYSSNMRVKVNGVVVSDVDGNTSYSNNTSLFPYAAAGISSQAIYDI